MEPGHDASETHEPAARRGAEPAGAPAPSPARGPAAEWFAERVRPLLAFDTQPGAAWVPPAEVTSDATLGRIERTMWLADGAPTKVALTSVAGWTGGFVARAIAVGLLRDGVLLRLSRARGLQVLHDPGGWLADLRFDDAPLAVAPTHPLAGQPGVEVVDDPAARFGPEIAALCAPWIKTLAPRSGRSAAGLWAQIPDRIALMVEPLAAVESAAAAPAADDLRRWADATLALLGGPGTPWRHRPKLTAREGVGGRAASLALHRSTCCLWYRCELPGEEHPTTGVATQRAEPPVEVPDYCSTCVFRTADDVITRAAGA